MSWRLIKTAPKNGDEFIACTAGHAPFSCRWHRDAFVHLDPDDGVILYEPTHWQPMPERLGVDTPKLVADNAGEERIGGLTDGEWMLEGFYREPKS